MPAPELPPLPDDIVEMFNARRAGFNEGIGLTFVSIAYDELCAEVPVGPHLHQPYGLVHGGVYSTIVETLASAGAAINAMPSGYDVVGLENATSFLSAVREGTLHARGVPLFRGKRSQVWEVTVASDDGRVAAKGRVRMLCLEAGSNVAGETVTVKTGQNRQ